MPLATSYRNVLVAAGFGSSHVSGFPATCYVGLSKTNPATSVTEPSGLGYTRVAIPNTTSDNGTTSAFTTPANGQVANNALVTFPVSTGNWGTCTHFVLYDASTGGNLIGYDALTVSVAVTTDMVVQFPSGSLTITVSAT